MALYKEMLYNYIAINTINSHRNDKQPEIGLYMALHTFRVECYKNALEKELSLFYQLKEADGINIVQGSLADGILNFSNDVKSLSTEPFSNSELFLGILSLSNEFQDTLALLFYKKKFDLKILGKLSSEEAYRNVLRKGKEVSVRTSSKHEEQ
jgi:hypothetical protein